MLTSEEKTEFLLELRRDIARGQKKGLHFILAAVVIWTLVFQIHLSPLTLRGKNTLTFLCSMPIFPLAVFFSKLIHVDFFDKSNPLSKPGITFAVNQMLYIPISVWAYYAYPEKMLMIYAVITGAHLLPYTWLYCSNVYFYSSIVITAAAAVVGWIASPSVLAAVMLLLFVLFCVCLSREVRRETKEDNYNGFL